MTAVIIGLLSGLFIILVVALLNGFKKPTIYGLILSGIGFLYVGFTWTDLHALIINAAQAIFFMLLAYFGVRKNIFVLIAGYFAHGIWDLLYDLFPNSNLIPPHYDAFCLSVDFTIGFYLLFIQYRNSKSVYPLTK
jgi:uncharacterized protein DUF6010